MGLLTSNVRTYDGLGLKNTYFLRTAMFLVVAEALLVVNMRAANFSTESEIISNV